MKGPQSVWLVIHMIRGEDGARRIVDMLTQEGLVAKTATDRHRITFTKSWY